MTGTDGIFSDGTLKYKGNPNLKCCLLYTSDETFKTTMRQEYNIGVSGGSDNFSFYTSFGYLQDDVQEYRW